MKRRGVGPAVFCGERGIKGKKGIGGRATARVAPTERFVGAEDPVRPAPITKHLVGQGLCALPGVREKNPPGTASP